VSERVYIHGESDEEAERLLEQAEILGKWVLDDLDFTGVEHLLEVGVGVGAETRLYRRRWPALRVTGLDFSPHQLERARVVLARDLAASSVQLVRGSGLHLPFAQNIFDAALLIWVLEHVPDPQAVLRECARCLRPGGRVFVQEVYNTTLYIEPRRPIIQRYFDALCDLQRAGGGHPDIAPRLPLLAERVGLTIDSFRWVGPRVDAHDREECVRLIRYFEGICRSAEPQLRAAGNFPASDIPLVWQAFDEVVADPDAMLSYISGKLIARK
jgi:ubiquinone/menaquinone biosynthesis C-methylase UbiE